MKSFITAALVALTMLSSAVYAVEEVKIEPKSTATTKKVCKDVLGKDNKVVVNKDGTNKQTCKTIKVHKKLEGTEVPVKK
jgi:hypothetical protein